MSWIQHRSLRATLTFLLMVWSFCIVGVVRYLIGTLTAYTSLDMVPYFMHSLDSSILQNDFLAQASSQPNPRQVFGWIVLTAIKIFHVGWYDVFYFLLALLILLSPVVVFLTLTAYLNGKGRNTERLSWAQIVLATGIVLAYFPFVSYVMPVGKWQIFDFTVAPHWASHTLGFIALFLLKQKTTWVRVLAIGTMFVATLIHPSVALCIAAFGVLLDIDNLFKNWKPWLLFLFAGLVIPLGIVQQMFPSDHPISTLDFIRIYSINAHEGHYYLPAYYSLTGFLPWFTGGVLLLLAFAAATFAGWHKRNKSLFLFACLSAMTYVGCFVLQHLGTVILPSKLIATLGPSRFAMLGYWLALFSLAWASTLFAWEKVSALAWLRHLPVFSWRSVLLSGVMLFLLLFLFKDNPFTEKRNARADFYQWLDQTPGESVFAVYPSEFLVDIGNVGQRAVFVGNGFPFHERSFLEYDARSTPLYGSYEETKHLGGKPEYRAAQHYNALTATEFVALGESYRLDYILVSSDNTTLRAYKPVYEESEFRVYSLVDLTEER